jgi:hypothetical protein
MDIDTKPLVFGKTYTIPPDKIFHPVQIVQVRSQPGGLRTAWQASTSSVNIRVDWKWAHRVCGSSGNACARRNWRHP